MTQPSKKRRVRALSRGVCAFLLPLLLLGFTGNALGIPAAPIMHTLEQPDGSQFKARQWGDEWSHGWETADGYTIIQNPSTDKWEYAVLNAAGRLESTGYAVGSDQAPADVPLHARPTGTSESQKMSQALDEAPQEVVPPTGTGNIPVLLGTFSDRTATYTTADFNTLLFGTGNYSMKDYYQEVSYGKFSVSSGPAGVRGWYPASKTHDYYGAANGTSKDSHPAEFVREIVALADSAVNFASYDSDGDCYVDTVAIVHQGTGEEASGVATDIWSHKWDLNSAKYYGDGAGEYITNDACPAGGSIKVNQYIIQPEIYGGQVTTMGVFAHEYGHALGLPDLYDTDGTSNGIGNWCLMAGGSWNYVSRGGDRPAHLSAWGKRKLGWAVPTTVSGTLTNEAISSACSLADVYRFSTGAATEYFLVENRQKCGFDAGLPGAGLAIWHVDEIKTNNKEECTTATGCPTTHYLVALEQADGLFELEKKINRGNSGDVYVAPKVFTPTSVPNSLTYGGVNNNISVTNISAAASVMTATLSTLPSVVGCTVYSAVPVRIDFIGSLAYLYFRPRLWSATGSSTMTANINPAISSWWYATLSTATTAGATAAVSYADAVINQTPVWLKGPAACPAAGSNASIGDIGSTMTINP